LERGEQNESAFRQGWAQTDITPLGPVFIAGQFNARLSEGVLDPLSATVWAIQSGDDHAVFVCCDLVAIPDEMRAQIRDAVERKKLPGLNSRAVILNATHSHAAPEIRTPSKTGGHTSSGGAGVELAEATPIQQYVDFAVGRIVEAIAAAWSRLAPGAVAYGWGTAVIGRNRRWVSDEGKSTMYNLKTSPDSRFRHIEGGEDHSLNVMATYDEAGKLTGLIINVPCPSQKSEHLYQISADYWCETRKLLRSQYGEELFILPQCSAAGDLSPHLLLDSGPYARMLKLKGRTERDEIASLLVGAINDIVPYIRDTREANPVVKLSLGQLDLPANRLTEQDAIEAEQEAERLLGVFEQEKRKLEEQPELRAKDRWYVAASAAYRRANWFMNVRRRYEYQKTCDTLPAEVNVIRIGDVALATVPFELYLDFGNQMKIRSVAKQTFVVQLAGGGTYLPSPRSVQGGGYGSVPASNPLGPEGGQVIADHVTEQIGKLMDG
jgi:hypothetical protein